MPFTQPYSHENNYCINIMDQAVTTVQNESNIKNMEQQEQTCQG